MPKKYVQHSLERDAYLARREDKQTSLQRLKTTVERLARAMSLSEADKAELLVYAEQLLEQHDEADTQVVRARDAYRRTRRHPETRSGILQEKTPSATTDGAQASE